jgi:hypothetical protein
MSCRGGRADKRIYSLGVSKYREEVSRRRPTGFTFHRMVGRRASRRWSPRRPAFGGIHDTGRPGSHIATSKQAKEAKDFTTEARRSRNFGRFALVSVQAPREAHRLLLRVSVPSRWNPCFLGLRRSEHSRMYHRRSAWGQASLVLGPGDPAIASLRKTRAAAPPHRPLERRPQFRADDGTMGRRTPARRARRRRPSGRRRRTPGGGCGTG